MGWVWLLWLWLHVVPRKSLLLIRQNRLSLFPLQNAPVFDAAAESVASSGFNENVNVQQFIQYEVKNRRFSAEELRNFFNGVVYKGNIITIMYRPSTSRPWYEFRTGNSGVSKFNGGKQFYAANRAVIDDVAHKYGVPAELIVAILGIETNYGKNTGSFRVADALSTLAFDYPRRAEFFQNELSELLQMAKKKKKMSLTSKAAMPVQWVCRNLCLQATVNGRWTMMVMVIAIFGIMLAMWRPLSPII